MAMMDIISHPGKPLIVHLREVARSCEQTLGGVSLGLAIDQELLQKIGFIQGAVHDIGKATRNFQEYIRSGGEIVTPPKHHALISAYLAKAITQQFLQDKDIAEMDKALLPYFVFTSVKRHHGNVKNFDDELETLFEKEEDVKVLVGNFYEEEVQTILDELLAEIGIRYDWKDFKADMTDVEAVFYSFADFSIDYMKEDFARLETSQRVAYFYLHHLLFSTLLFSDKTDVKLGKDKLKREVVFPFDAIQHFRDKKGFNAPTSEINQLKNQAYFESLAYLKEQFNPDQHLYSITLPTGLGKTITSLALAMELKQLVSSQHPRIIITIPFTSIIDQNYAVFQEIFDHPMSAILLKHHHLAEPLYKMGEDTVLEKEVERSQFLIETWQSEIVVTTFVQLLEGIFTNNKGKLLKLPQLMNAIIVLDEIQQIRYELWELVRTAFKVLAERYHCYFIMMSATQPLIFEPGKEIVELIPNYRQYFRFFNRTKLMNKIKEPVSLAAFSNEVVAYHQRNPRKSLLVVLNTKDTTLSCFKAVSEQIPASTANLYFLSTFITPFERKQIIHRIKHPPNTLPNIIISTQLIEAGVDISVQAIFRALAPIDSIIQAAGRANRYAENETPADIFLYKIEELEKITNRLYGSDLMIKTVNVLATIDVIEERNYLQLIEAYYREVRKQSDHHLSVELGHLAHLRFEDLGKFSFIPYRKTESLFVQLNQAALKVWEKYVGIYQDSSLSIFEKREAFARIKSSFYDYVINVPVPYDRESIVFDTAPYMHFYLSRLDNPSSCYSYDHGDYRNNRGYQALETASF